MTDTDTRNIWTRVNAARANFSAVVKNRTADAGKYSYRYVDLGTVLEAIEEPLRAEGVEIFHWVRDGKVVTNLMPLGDRPIPLFSEFPLPVDGDPQRLGSAITYARRYNLVALLNLVVDDDDDAASVSGSERTPSTSRVTAPEVEPELPPAPAGWESPAQSLAAHNDLVARIRALPEDFAEPCRAFRGEHGWPLSLPQFEELEGLVRVAEGFSPDPA